MRQFSAIFVSGAILILLCGCGGGSSVGPLSITFTSAPVSVPGGTNFVFSVTTQNDTLNRGVTFTLALNEPSDGDTTTPCTTSCGALSGQTNTITANGPDTFTSTTTVNYAAPLLPPTPNSLILTATAVANSGVTITDTFSIGAPQIVVHITNKITNIAPEAEPVTLNAQVLFDAMNAGVTWALTAQGAGCSPACGALSSAEPFSVVYTPPATLPAAPNNTPTITATSVTTTTVSDFDDIRIQASTQPISVSILNPFAQINAGSAGVTINANVENDVASQGVTWSLEPAAQTGVLSAQQPLSVIYTPPNTAPQPPNNTPTITATSVADPTKSASFNFTIAPAAAFQGAYAFIIRGHDSSGNTLAAAGSLASDGAGKIVRGEIDVTNRSVGTDDCPVPVAGNYEIEKAEDGSQIVHIEINGVHSANRLSAVSFSAAFAVRRSVGFISAYSGASDAVSYSTTGKISGQSGDWILDGEIAEQEVRSVAISSLARKEFDFQLFPGSNSAASEIGRFALTDSGELVNGSLTLVPSESVGTEGAAVTGNLNTFDAIGRSTLTVLFAGSDETRQFAVYVVSPMRLMLIEIASPDSPRTPRAGDAISPGLYN